jgi:hypothetical protein
MPDNTAITEKDLEKLYNIYPEQDVKEYLEQNNIKIIHEKEDEEI